MSKIIFDNVKFNTEVTAEEKSTTGNHSKRTGRIIQ